MRLPPRRSTSSTAARIGCCSPSSSPAARGPCVPGGAAAAGALCLHAERGAGMLSLTLDSADDDGDGARPEALHWIDARRPAADDESSRLVYRPGSVNVVQIIIG